MLLKNKKYYENNKDIIIEKAKQYYAENSYEIKKRIKTYRTTEKGKEVKRNSSAKRRANQNGKISTEYLLELKKNTEICQLCNSLLTEEDGDNKYHLDHIIPLFAGGEHIEENVRYICRKCNLTRPKDGSDI